MSKLCPICKGSGGIVTFAPMTFWDCLYCGGSGVTVQSGPALLTTRKNLPKKVKKQQQGDEHA